MGPMALVEVLLIALALSLDALAVSVAAACGGRTASPRAGFRLAFHFGLFQALMPVLGWLATLSMVAAAIISFVHAGFTQRDAISRSQFRWAVGGSVAGMLLVLLVFPAAAGLIAHPLLAQLMGSGLHLGFTVIGIALGIAIGAAPIRPSISAITLSALRMR